MDFNQLLAKMQEIDTVKTEAPADIKTDECGMMPPAPMSTPEPKDKASMSININAQGDAIEDVMALIKKMGGEDKPGMADMPTMSIIPPMGGMDAPMDAPEGPPMPKPINKLLPDFDGDNDDMPGGEKDLPKDHDKDHIMIKALDKDGDDDHDMDDHDMEKDDDEKDKEEAWANEPDEDNKDIDFMQNKMSGGMNRRKGTHPKVAGGDNPMQKVGESDLVATIKAELQRALAETKGAK